MLKRPAFHVFALLMLVLVPLELVCAYLAYETIGEISSMLTYFAVGLNLIFIVVALRYPRAAAVGAVLLGMETAGAQLSEARETLISSIDDLLAQANEK